MKKTAMYAFSRTIPVMCGYLFLGTAYGLVMQQAGYGWGWSALASFSIYAGSMQFVLAGMLTAGASLVTAAVTAFLVNGRHIFYGLSLLDKFSRQKGIKRFYMISALTDETYSLLISPHPDHIPGDRADFLITLFDQCYWVLGSFLGGVLGQAISMDLTGIDFSMTALFVVILVEQMREKENRPRGMMGLLVSAAVLLVMGQQNFLLPAMALIVAFTLIMPEGGKQKK